MPFTSLFCLFSSRLLTLSITLFIFLSYSNWRCLAGFIPFSFYCLNCRNCATVLLKASQFNSIFNIHKMQSHYWPLECTLIAILLWWLWVDFYLIPRKFYRRIKYVHELFMFILRSAKKKLRKITSNLIFHFIFLFFVHFPSDFIWFDVLLNHVYKICLINE